MRGKVRPVSIRKNQEVSASKPKKQSFSAPKGTNETPKPNMGRRCKLQDLTRIAKNRDQLRSFILRIPFIRINQQSPL
jgi:hypothetical protein